MGSNHASFTGMETLRITRQTNCDGNRYRFSSLSPGPKLRGAATDMGAMPYVANGSSWEHVEAQMFASPRYAPTTDGELSSGSVRILRRCPEDTGDRAPHRAC